MASGPLEGPISPATYVPVDWNVTYDVISERVAYTEVAVFLGVCPRCGRRTAESHGVRLRRGGGPDRDVGETRACWRCDPEHWLFYVRGPVTAAARRREERTVP